MEPTLVIETRSIAYHAIALPLELHWLKVQSGHTTAYGPLMTNYSVFKDHKKQKGRNLSIPALEKLFADRQDLWISTRGRFDRVGGLCTNPEMESASH